MAQKPRTAEAQVMSTESETPVLPIFYTRENRLSWGIFLYFIVLGIYLTTNHFHAFEPRPLPLTWIDRETPFLPITVWMYLSEYPLFALTYLTVKDMPHLNRFFYAMLAMQVINGVIFCFFPTTYPRHAFPLPAELDPITRAAFDWLRTADSPANCFPSLHVSGIFLNAFVFFRDQRKLFWVFLIWGVLIAISTLTTKQHYFADVIGGLLLACTVFYFFFHRFQYVDFSTWQELRRQSTHDSE